MTANDLIAAFDTLADAPEGVKRLRELVLQLAVRGKLVPPDDRVGDAEEVMQALRLEREALVREGLLREPRVATIKDALFDLPTGWRWTTLASTALAVTDGDHLPPPKSDAGVPFVVIGNVSSGGINLSETRFVPRSYFDALDWSRRPKKGDLLYTVTGSYGIVVPVDIDVPFCVQRHIGIIKTARAMNNAFLTWALRSLYCRSHADAVATGIAQKTVPLSGLRTMPIPLPPLAEQHRIVARVDELMGLLDRLEAARIARDDVRRAARDAALAALRDAEDSDAVEAAWRRIAGQMDALFTEPEDVGPLRQAVLGLAVRGRLVPQNPADGNAEKLLARCEMERKLASVRFAPVPPLSSSELPALPPTWQWTRLGALLLDVVAGWSPSAQGRPKEGDEWGVLRVSACSWGRFLPEENKALGPDTAPRTELEVRDGDLLISRANTVALVARSVVVESPPPRLMLSDKTLRLVPVSLVNIRYVNLANLSDVTRTHYAANASGTSDSMRNVSQAAIRDAPIALPPAAEQHRIVAKVDALMAFCDALEVRLTTARALHGQFAAAAVHHLDV